MREPFVVTDELPTIHVYFQRSTDTVTMRLQEQYGLMLVYPSCNGTDGCNGFNVKSLNTTFLPDRHRKSEPIYIMWTSIMLKPRKGLWSPNHFVPLLALTDVPGIASVPQTDFSYQSPTYQQEFPDLTSSMKAKKTQKRQKMPQLIKKKNLKKSKHYEQDSEHDFSSSFEEVQSAKRQKLSATPSKKNKTSPICQAVLMRTANLLTSRQHQR